MNTVIYCRVSSREQVDGTSLESQEAACREHARQKNLTVLKVFRGRGESAKVADRPELVDLLNYCKARENMVHVLLVWKLDRFARNVEDHFAIKATLRQYGVQVVSVTEPIDGDPTGRLMETMLAGFAQFDNDVRTARTKLGMQQRLRYGVYPWKPPLGYLPPRLGKKTVPDRPDPDRFVYLRKAWHLYATGAYTKAAILRMLRNWNVLGYKGRRLSAEVLDKIFANQFYAGILRDPWTGQEYEGKHERMVTPEQFRKVRRIVARRGRSVRHLRFHPAFPLRGHVRCPSCHKVLTGTFARGSRARYPYYECQQPSCPTRRKSYRAADVHREFDSLLVERTVQPDLTRTVLAAVLAAARRVSEDERQRGELRREAVKRCRHQLQELVTMRASLLITTEEFLSGRESVTAELQRLEDEGQDAGRAQELETDDILDFADSMSNLPGLWNDLTLEGKHSFVSTLFQDGYVLGTSRTAESALLFRVLEPSAHDESRLVPFSRELANQVLSEIMALLAILPKRVHPSKDVQEV